MSSQDQNISEVIEFVLDEWGMMMAEPLENGLENFNSKSSFIRVEAHFQGAFDGWITIFCQDSFARLLAENVLGLEPDSNLSEEERLDFIRELANILSGNYLTSVYGEDRVFESPEYTVTRQSMPEMETFLKQKHGSDFSSTVHYYSGDDEPLGVAFEKKTQEDS